MDIPSLAGDDADDATAPTPIVNISLARILRVRSVSSCWPVTIISDTFPGGKYAIRFSEYPYISLPDSDLRKRTEFGHSVRNSGAIFNLMPLLICAHTSLTVTTPSEGTMTHWSSPYWIFENAGVLNSSDIMDT